MSARLAAVLDGYLDLRWRIDPVEASAAGIHTFDGKLANFDALSVREYIAALRAYALSLEEEEADSLDDEIDRTAALHAVRHDLLVLEREKPFARDPAYHLTHALNGIFVLLVRNGAGPDHRARAVLERLREIPAFLDRARTSLTRPGRIFVESARGMVKGGLALLSEAVGDEVMGSAAVSPDDVRTAHDDAAKSMLEFGAELAEIAERADDDFAIGRDLFDKKLHTAHMIQDNADELLRYGQRLRAEAEAELERLSAEIKPGSDWRNVVRELRADVPTRESAIEEFAQAMRNARSFTAERGLMTVVTSPLDVVPTPGFLDSLVPFAAYQPPPAFSEDQRGLFFVTLPDHGKPWRGQCRSELPSTALHEGVPGHHQHLVSANRRERPVRRVLATPAMVEGWALYCESLMAEQGFFTTPAERLFQAHHLLWRALRIELDVSLQTRGMTPEAASQVLQQDLGFDPASADAEVRRYCSMPTYQLCYAVGRRDLLRLRDDARRARGDAFSLAAFHDELLSYGVLPVALARWGMGL
ncbi:MAG: DUF885 domain-containing protein [Gemmatimonadaceae bacterium]